MSYTYSFDQYPLKELSPFDSPETIFDSPENFDEYFLNQLIENDGDEEAFYSSELDEDFLICAFCESVWDKGVKLCSNCNEYKGLMTIDQFDKTYGG